MTNLQGTEKQIAWAEEIKAKFIEDTEAKLADLQSENPTSRESYKRAYGDFADINMRRDAIAMEAALSVVGNISEAREWIDGRQNPMRMVEQRLDFTLAKESIRRSTPKKQKADSQKKPSILEILRAQQAKQD